MIEMNNSTKSNKSDDKKQTKPQQNKQNGSVNTEKKEQNNEKSNQQEQPKEETQTKSNGVWIDSENQKWANKDVPGTNIKCQRKYSADEYDKRDDIKFMVSYGEMKLTTVE